MSTTSAAEAGDWLEYKSKDGRIYWANSVTKESSWDKPDVLKSPFERAITNTKWKQYTSKGKTYFVNSITKETQWDLPDELVQLKKKLDIEAAKARGEYVEPGEDGNRRLLTGGEQDEDKDKAVALRDRAGSRASSPSSSEAEDEELEEQDDLAIGPPPIMPPNGFQSIKDAEDAFIWLLKKFKVDESWSWDKVMRTLIMEPLYKALNSSAEKKNAWQKYINNLQANRDQIRKERVDRFRPYINRLLTRSRNLKSYTSFGTADILFKNEKYWRDLEYEDERRQLFNEYMSELNKKERAAERELDERNIKVLTALVAELPINVSTRWRAAREMIEDSEQFKNDRDLQQVDRLAMLRIFEGYAQQILRTHEEQMRKSKLETMRRARKARDGFRALLSDMESQGKIGATTKWKEFLLLIEERDEYNAILGMPGSGPLELFQDVVDDIAEAISTSGEKVKSAVEKAGRHIELGWKPEQLQALLLELKISNLVPERHLELVNEYMQTQLEKAAREERKRAERRKRHLMDDLRYAMKKAEPPINLDGPFEEAAPIMEQFREFADLDDQARKDTFDRFVRKQKDKLRERERERDQGRSEEGSPRHKERRDRTERRSVSPTGSRHGRSRNHHEADKTGDRRRREKEEEGEATDEDMEDKHVSKRPRPNEEREEGEL